MASHTTIASPACVPECGLKQKVRNLAACASLALQAMSSRAAATGAASLLEGMNAMLRMLAVSLLLLASTAACNQKQGAAKKEADKAAEGDKAAKAGEKPKSDCDKYAEAICEKVGDTSPDCGAIKQVANIMAPAACKAGMGDLAFTEKQVAEARKSCTDLANKLCGDLGEETESCKMVRDQTPKFPPQRCSMMMDKYADVLADLKKREEANKPLTDEKQASLIENAVATFGPTDAKVKIIEFSDFQCPFCSRAANSVTEIKKKYGDKVQFVFRQFPLSFHKQAHLAAEASMEAAEQGKFWEFHDKMFEHQRELEREKLEGYAKDVGLDLAKFKKALDSGAHKEAVDSDLKLGEEVAVTGTPTMFLNGKRVSNPTDVAALSKAIDEALAN